MSHPMTSKELLARLPEFRPMPDSYRDAFAGAEEGTMMLETDDIIYLVSGEFSVQAYNADGEFWILQDGSWD